ncbi:MAG TPA: redox-sensing transcriptional repressor Rex [Thermoanaerobaculia bacterium]|nr:redox-sensing transcriptional repressor Rex [Thermoanaerobaculia bacterium]
MEASRPAVSREPISELTTSRLSIYLRCLTYLESLNQKTVSSAELARRFHLNSAQIRKDLAQFGDFGIRGVGYNVTLLKEHLIRTLGIDRARRMIIVGAGNLGMALAGYRGFNSSGFHIAALVDSDPKKTDRRTRSGIPILSFDHLGELVARERVEIGIIAVPAEEAQAVCDSMVDAGICAVLNFAPVQIRGRAGVKVKSVDLRINLESLSFYLKNVEDGCTPASSDGDLT